MFDNCYKPPEQDIVSIQWNGNPIDYDIDLSSLGNGKDRTLILNPRLPDKNLIHHADEFPDTDQCIVYIHDGDWVAKVFPPGWEPHWNAYLELEIVKPKLVWNKNPDIDKLMTFENDPFGSFEPEPWDCDYKLVWYLDPRVNPLPDKVWAMSCQPIGREIKGVKEMGYLMPQIDVEFNEFLPDLGVDVNECYPAFYHLNWECAWELDPVHQTDRQLWVVKFTPKYRKPKGWKWYGVISPNFTVKYNPDLPNMNYDLDYIIPWHDLAYKHVWMLDNKHLLNGEEEMWAFSVVATNKPVGTKFIDYISPSPEFEVNPEVEGYDFEIDYDAPWHDLAYEHVWMLDPAHYPGHEEIWAVKQKYCEKVKGAKLIEGLEPEQTIEYNRALKNLYFEIDYKIPYHDRNYSHVWYTELNGKEIWAAKLKAASRTKGTKDMGRVVPMIPKQLDVFFISYNEPNADENWNRLLKFAPGAKRVHGVKGILNAHKAAAELSETDMFYVVDGDAWVVDDWNFSFQPSLYDRDCVHLWTSSNPVTGTNYGYGGIKLFPTSAVKKIHRWGTDLTLSVGKKLKVFDDISNISKFNVSEFDTWRSAFRESAKLALKDDETSQQRLESWLNPKPDTDFYKWAKLGAEQGRDYAESNPSIDHVNDYSWLKAQFDKIEKA